MKRSIRWYLAWGIMVASMSMLFFMVTAGPAQAWTQENNSFTCDQNGKCTGNPNCGSESSPCLYWNEGVRQSVQLYFWLDPALQNVGGYNFVVPISDAFQQYNSLPAWNPYLYIWQSGDPTFGGAYGMGLLPCGALGVTNVYGDGNIVYRYNAYWKDYEWDEWIVNTATTFNPLLPGITT